MVRMVHQEFVTKFIEFEFPELSLIPNESSGSKLEISKVPNPNNLKVAGLGMGFSSGLFHSCSKTQTVFWKLFSRLLDLRLLLCAGAPNLSHSFPWAPKKSSEGDRGATTASLEK